VAGVTVGTMALIIIMSVFNGFESLVIRLFNTFNPDIEIRAVQGKTFNINDLRVDEIKKIPGVFYYTETIEENALLKYKDKQFIATIKGVNSDYQKLARLDTMVIDGAFMLSHDSVNFAVVGQGVAYNLDLALNDMFNPLEVYVPRKEGNIQTNITDAFNSEVLMPSAVFSVQQDYDVKYVFVPIAFARKIMGYTTEVSSVELGVEKNADMQLVQEKVKQIAGEKFTVKNRFEQQEMLYKIMKSEKWAIILILTFILLIATFNVIATITMLILDKKKDIAVLWSMGAEKVMLRKIFLIEGMIIMVVGAILGMALGGLVCWLQQHYGFVKMPDNGAFVITSYPVDMKFADFIYVLLIDLAIGIGTAWYPVTKISRKNLEIKF
jgi:lipoprotein-releasing system permease protein